MILQKNGVNEPFGFPIVIANTMFQRACIKNKKNKKSGLFKYNDTMIETACKYFVIVTHH